MKISQISTATRRKFRTVVITALLAVGGVAVGATAAFADEPTAPACINRQNIQWYSVILTNNCPPGAGYYLKVIFDSAPDSSCFWLASGASRRVDGDTRYPYIEYNRTVVCG
ncbi:hypothetical protein FXF51_25990 [Nonomuraea sp. PA05]|uniref:hypothetical protein n=1 Tax=Nonomuraea sp. PA05 TaxID=2604466 RepID=UPI0011DB851D|nr:hypothetical protein [Nonomuraea sp. PA05]TYB62176.1 hypothetical protein FXF51_25990 [Nonomuraea sp. PA05]